MFRVRGIRPGDYAAVDQLLHELYDVHAQGRPELFGPVGHCLNETFFSDMLTNEDMIAVGAEIDRRLVAVCIASMLNFSGNARIKTVCVDQLVVAKQHRRQGIALRLLQETEKRARRLGAKRLDLIVWSFNTDAVAVYEKYGMTPQRIIYEKAL